MSPLREKAEAPPWGDPTAWPGSSNADLKALAREVAEDDPEMDGAKVSRLLGCSPRTVSGWVSDIVNARREERAGKVARLTRLGWTSREIAGRLDVAQTSVARDLNQNGSSAESVHDLLAKGAPEAEVATRFNMPEQLVWSIGLGRTLREEVTHIRNGRTAVFDDARREERAGKVARLTRLGWTQQQIADHLTVDLRTVERDRQNGHSAEMSGRDLLAR